MVKVCIDTNVWLSGFAFSGAPSEIVTLAMNKKIGVVTSGFILKELERNLVSKIGVHPKKAANLCFRIAQISDVYEPKGTVNVIQGNHGDNLVLETAWIGRAKYLVTGDKKHILPIKIFRNIKILEPSKLLEVLSFR
ncbi:putative toxin-antitoxin system toxin component, PIN family [Bdellovibrionota bacterium FG-2]